jgi:hypothetical protein
VPFSFGGGDVLALCRSSVSIVAPAVVSDRWLRPSVLAGLARRACFGLMGRFWLGPTCCLIPEWRAVAYVGSSRVLVRWVEARPGGQEGRECWWFQLTGAAEWRAKVPRPCSAVLFRRGRCSSPLPTVRFDRWLGGCLRPLVPAVGSGRAGVPGSVRLDVPVLAWLVGLIPEWRAIAYVSRVAYR